MFYTSGCRKKPLMTGVIFLHGIGNNVSSGYSNIMRDSFGESYFYKEINWQALVEPRQKRLFESCKAKLKYGMFRKLMASYATDAVTYQQESDFYKTAHKLIGDAIKELMSLGVDRIVFVAHSLGTVLVSNFLWDVVNSKSIGNYAYSLDDECKEFLFNSLQDVVFIGSPVSLWSMKYTDGGRCISMDKFNNFRNISNIYSKYDFIAWPLRCINKTYQIDKIVDIPYSYGGFFWKVTPMGHTKIWGDKNLIKRIKEIIK
jgi:hypothetical protein